MKDLNYVIGRLQGLNELVKILKDLVDKKGVQDSDITKVMTDHISSQLTSIISEFDTIDAKPKQKQALADIKEKHDVAKESSKEAAPEPKKEDSKEALDKHEKTVDDLLKDLESLKTQ